MLYDKSWVAHLLGVSVKTVERAVTSGELKCCRIGSKVRFTKENIEEFAGGSVADTEKPELPRAEGRNTIPPDIIAAFEQELDGISHGSVTLTVHLRDGRPRFVIGRERSFIRDEPEREGA
jgi:excisionase family DNA binding protein